MAHGKGDGGMTKARRKWARLTDPERVAYVTQLQADALADVARIVARLAAGKTGKTGKRR